MATIKSYTDLSQSKVLAEILPLESADMRYDEYTSHIDGTPKVGYKEGITEGIPCWSLAALLDVIRKTIGYTIYGVCDVYMSCELGDFKKIETKVYDNPIDACYELILKLHELNLL